MKDIRLKIDTEKIAKEVAEDLKNDKTNLFATGQLKQIQRV